MSRIFGMAIAVAATVIAALLLPAAASAAAPANDDLANAEIVSGASGSVSGSTAEATIEVGEPCEFTCGKSVWYSWTSPSATGADVSFSLCGGAAFDTVLLAYTGSTLETIEAVAGNDDNCGGASQSEMSFTAAAGVSYLVRVTGYPTAFGPFTLAWSSTALPGGDSDTTAPVLTVPASVLAQATTATGATVPYTATATDANDGPVAVTCSPGSGTLFALGTTTVSCSAQDAAGNVASASFPVTVTFAWSGFLAPVSDGMTWRRAVPLPIRFRLTGYSGNVKNAVARISVSKVSGTTETPVALDKRLGDRFVYVAVDHAYWYILPTHSLSRATYRVRVNLGDGVQRSFDVSMR